MTTYTRTVSNGQATLSGLDLTPGHYTVQTSYPQNSNYQASTSNSKIKVKYPTQRIISFQGNVFRYGYGVYFTEEILIDQKEYWRNSADIAFAVETYSNKLYFFVSDDDYYTYDDQDYETLTDENNTFVFTIESGNTQFEIYDSNGSLLLSETFSTTFGNTLYMNINHDHNAGFDLSGKSKITSISNVKFNGAQWTEFYSPDNYYTSNMITADTTTGVIEYGRSCCPAFLLNVLDFSEDSWVLDFDYSKVGDGRWQCGFYNPSTDVFIGIHDGENLRNTATGLNVTDKYFQMGNSHLYMKLESDSLYIKGVQRRNNGVGTDGEVLEYTIPITQSLDGYYFVLCHTAGNFNITNFTSTINGITDTDITTNEQWLNPSWNGTTLNPPMTGANYKNATRYLKEVLIGD